MKLTDHLRALEAKATEGKWRADHEHEKIYTVPNNANGNRQDQICFGVYCQAAYKTHHEKDFEFIAAARNSLATLLDQLDIYREALEACTTKSMYAADTKEHHFPNATCMRVLASDALARADALEKTIAIREEGEGK